MRNSLLISMLALASCNGVGHVTLSWTLAFSNAPGTTIKCAADGSETVQVTIGAHVFTFPCASGNPASGGRTVTSPAIPWGTYDHVTADLYFTDSTGARLLEDSLTLSAVQVDAGATTDLPPVAFQIALTTGNLELDVTLSSPNTNSGTQARVCNPNETLKVDLNDGSTPQIFACLSGQPWVLNLTNVPDGVYAKVDVSLLYKGNPELGPTQTGANSFSNDNNTPEILEFGGSVPSTALTITAGQTNVQPLIFYVNTCSFAGGTNPDCTPAP